MSWNKFEWGRLYSENVQRSVVNQKPREQLCPNIIVCSLTVQCTHGSFHKETLIMKLRKLLISCPDISKQIIKWWNFQFCSNAICSNCLNSCLRFKMLKNQLYKYLQRLVKHTDADHPDFALLQRAEREIHDLALRINNVERESDEQEGRQQMLRCPNFSLLFGEVSTLRHMIIVVGVAHVVTNVALEWVKS